MKIKYHLLIILIIIINLPPSAMGGIPAAYVDIGYGARPMGMGGAFVALANDAHAVLWNPAGLIRLKSTNATFMWTKQLNLIPYYFIAAGRPINNRFSLGTAAISSGNDVLRETTFLLSCAYKLPLEMRSPLNRINVGVNLKLRNSSYGNNADGGENQIKGDALGFGIDLGAQWMISPIFFTGILLRDIVSPVSYHNKTLDKTYSESVPPTLIIGAVYSAIKNLLLAADWEQVLSADNNDKFHIGMEYKIINIFVLRAGLNQPIDRSSDKKYTLGLGLFYKKKGVLSLSFDFAYEFFFLANTPKVSTSIWF